MTVNKEKMLVNCADTYAKDIPLELAIYHFLFIFAALCTFPLQKLFSKFCLFNLSGQGY